MTAASSRRRFLQGAGAGALSVTIGPAVVPLTGLAAPAVAQASGDPGIAAFVESIELAAAEAYQTIAAAGRITTAAVMEQATFYASHHQEHAQTIGAEAGDAATGTANRTLIELLRSQISEAADETAVLEILFDLENAMAATHLFAIERFEAAYTRELVASILPVEGQHAVVFGAVLDRDLDEIFPAFQTQDQAFDPDEYPIDE